MKKSAVLLLVALMVLAPACAPAPTETEPAEVPSAEAPTATTASEGPAERPILAVVLPAVDNPLMLGFQSAFTETFGTDYDVQVASAEGNAITQATQVENYTAMGAEFMFVMAVEASSLVPSMIAAREAGVTILTAGGDPGEPGLRQALHRPHDHGDLDAGEGLARRGARTVRADPARPCRRRPALRARDLRGSEGLPTRRRHRVGLPAGGQRGALRPIGAPADDSAKIIVIDASGRSPYNSLVGKANLMVQPLKVESLTFVAINSWMT